MDSGGRRQAKMLDVQKRRAQMMLFIMGVLALSMTVICSREVQRNCWKGGCIKEWSVHILELLRHGLWQPCVHSKGGYQAVCSLWYIRTQHMERVRQRAIEKAFADAVSEGLTDTEAAKQAQKIGSKAAKVAARQANRILGPIISSGWDFFEAMYFGGSMTEGFLRGTGTLFGTYVGGFHGEQRLGKLGYLGGSHLGSWGGGRIGLMIYDVINGVKYMFHSVRLQNQ